MALIASWALFALLGLLWTGGALLTVELARWAAAALASGGVLEGGRALAQAPLPEWLTLWLDPAFARALQGLVAWSLDQSGQLLPFLGQAAGWLVPLVWVAWAVGCLLLLALAVGAHLLLRRFLRPKQPA